MNLVDWSVAYMRASARLLDCSIFFLRCSLLLPCVGARICLSSVRTTIIAAHAAVFVLTGFRSRGSLRFENASDASGEDDSNSLDTQASSLRYRSSASGSSSRLLSIALSAPPINKVPNQSSISCRVPEIVFFFFAKCQQALFRWLSSARLRCAIVSRGAAKVGNISSESTNNLFNDFTIGSVLLTRQRAPSAWMRHGAVCCWLFISSFIACTALNWGWLHGVPFTIPLWINGASCKDFLRHDPDSPAFSLRLIVSTPAQISLSGVAVGLPSTSLSFDIFDRYFDIAFSPLPLIFAYIALHDRIEASSANATAMTFASSCYVSQAVNAGVDTVDLLMLSQCLAAYAAFTRLASRDSSWDEAATHTHAMLCNNSSPRNGSVHLDALSLQVAAAILISTGAAVQATAVHRVSTVKKRVDAPGFYVSTNGLPADGCVIWRWESETGGALLQEGEAVVIEGKPICGAVHVRYGGRAGNALLELSVGVLLGWKSAAWASSGESTRAFPRVTYAVLPESPISGFGDLPPFLLGLCPHVPSLLVTLPSGKGESISVPMRILPSGTLPDSAIRASVIAGAEAQRATLLPEDQRQEAEWRRQDTLQLPAWWFRPWHALFLNDHYIAGKVAVHNLLHSVGASNDSGVPLTRTLYLKWYFERADTVSAALELGWRMVAAAGVFRPAPSEAGVFVLPTSTAVMSAALQLHPFLPSSVSAAFARTLVQGATEPRQLRGDQHGACVSALRAYVATSIVPAFDGSSGAAVSVSSARSGRRVAAAALLRLARLLQKYGAYAATVPPRGAASFSALSVLGSEQYLAAARSFSFVFPAAALPRVSAWETLMAAARNHSVATEEVLSACTLTAHVRIGDVALEAWRRDYTRFLVARDRDAGPSSLLSSYTVGDGPAYYPALTCGSSGPAAPDANHVITLPTVGLSSAWSTWRAAPDTSEAQARSRFKSSASASATAAEERTTSPPPSPSWVAAVKRLIHALRSEPWFELGETQFFLNAASAAAFVWAGAFNSDNPIGAWATAPHPQYLVDLQEVQCSRDMHHALPLSFYLRLLLGDQEEGGTGGPQNGRPSPRPALSLLDAAQALQQTRRDATIAFAVDVESGAWPRPSSGEATFDAGVEAGLQDAIARLFPHLSADRPWLHVHLVTEPSGLSHPILGAVAAATGASVQSSSLAGDFATLLAARQLLLSPSTFAWLAAGPGVGLGRAAVTHYPHHGFFSVYDAPPKHQCMLPAENAAGNAHKCATTVVYHDVLRMQVEASESARAAVHGSRVRCDTPTLFQTYQSLLASYASGTCGGNTLRISWDADGSPASSPLLRGYAAAAVNDFDSPLPVCTQKYEHWNLPIVGQQTQA